MQAHFAKRHPTVTTGRSSEKTCARAVTVRTIPIYLGKCQALGDSLTNQPPRPAQHRVHGNTTQHALLTRRSKHTDSLCSGARLSRLGDLSKRPAPGQSIVNAGCATFKSDITARDSFRPTYPGFEVSAPLVCTDQSDTMARIPGHKPTAFH